jgi:hypothetical protein
MTRTKDLALEQQENEFDAFLRLQQEQELRALEPIDLGTLRPTAATSEQIAGGIIEAVKEGRINPIELAVKKKCITDAFEMALKNEEIKSMCVSEVEKYGKEGATMFGATIKVTSTAKYDYSKDPKWKELNDSIADTLKLIKDQEERIKVACKNNASLIDQETGEVIASVVPCPKTDTVAVSFKSKK